MIYYLILSFQKSFFKNIGAILTFAVFGTLVATCLTSLGIYLVGYSKLIPVNSFTPKIFISKTKGISVHVN